VNLLLVFILVAMYIVSYRGEACRIRSLLVEGFFGVIQGSSDAHSIVEEGATHSEFVRGPQYVHKKSFHITHTPTC
jgi:hypothetical protein